MRMRRLAIVGLSLLATAPLLAAAEAEPGWILWEKNMINKAGSPEAVTWEPMDGYESIAECRKTGQEHLKNALSVMTSGAVKLLGPVRPDGRSAMFAVTEAGSQRTVDIRYLCFPGAFDPRAQQGARPAAKP